MDSLLAYAISLCFRNHATHNHLAAVNRHYFNCMATFRLLLESIDDKDAKANVLDKLAQAVFSVQDTGYFTNGGDGIQIGQIGDIAKTISGKG